MEKQYPSEKKAKEVFYASANKGTITGVHDRKHRSDTSKDCSGYMDACRRGDAVKIAKYHGRVVR